MKKYSMKQLPPEDHICLCDRCIAAIRSRGEKVFKLETLEECERFEDYDEEEQGALKCEWCQDEFSKDTLYDCVFA